MSVERRREVRRPYTVPANYKQKFSKMSLVTAQRFGLMQTLYPRTYAFHPLSSYYFLLFNYRADFSTDLEDCVHTSSDMISSGRYSARLSNPIILQTDMPGTGHILTHAEIQAELLTGWGTGIAMNDRHLKVDNDGSTDIWKVSGDRISFGGGSLYKNVYGTETDPLNIDLSSYSKINLEFRNDTSVWTGGMTTWMGRPLMTIMYVPTTPPTPSTVDVRVTNRTNSQPIKSAFVELLAGNIIVAEGNTDGNGNIHFDNIPGGMTGISYTISITAGNFHEYTESITVKPGPNQFAYSLVPVPVSPWMQYLQYGVIAATVLGGVYVGVKVIESRRRPPQYYPPQQYYPPPSEYYPELPDYRRAGERGR